MSLLLLAHVSKAYRRARRELRALADVSLEVAAGEVVGVWGPRFSGRTTLLRIAAGLEAPDEGKVLFDGVDVAAQPEGALRRRVAYCYTSFAPAHAELVVEHVLMTAADAAGLAGADRVLSLADGRLDGDAIPHAAEVVPLKRPRAEPSA